MRLEWYIISLLITFLTIAIVVIFKKHFFKGQQDTLSVDRFSFVQMFNNSKGKTSGSLVISIFACFNAVMCFVITGNIVVTSVLYAMINKVGVDTILTPQLSAMLNNLIFQALTLFTIGAAGLGIRRFTSDKEPVTGQPTPDLKVDTTTIAP